MVIEVNVIVVETLHIWQPPVHIVQIQHCKTLTKFLMYEFVELGNFLIHFFVLQDWRHFAYYKICGFKFFTDCFDQSVKVIKQVLCTCTSIFSKGVCTILENHSVKFFARILFDYSNFFLCCRSTVRMYCAIIRKTMIINYSTY